MTRPTRVEYEGAFYHVMNRGRGRQLIFRGDKYREAFLSCLEQAHRRFGLEIHAYCLMDNHYHLLVRTPRANLSRAMRHINGVYTQVYNRLMRTDGPLFRGRYKAINIDASSYLLEVSRYIHRNPVENKGPMVAELAQYRWSSYPSYRKKAESPVWLVKDAVMAELASGQPTAAYGRFVEQGLDEDTEAFYSKNIWPAVRGEKAFVDSAYLHALSTGKGVERVRYLVPLEVIVETVMRHCGCEESRIYVSSRGRGRKHVERWMAMRLARDYTGESLVDLSSRFGVKGYSTMSMTIGRLNKLLETDAELMELYNSISEDLTP